MPRKFYMSPDMWVYESLECEAMAQKTMQAFNAIVTAFEEQKYKYRRLCKVINLVIGD